MAGKIEKGKIDSIEQDKHVAKVITQAGLITYNLVIPFYLRKESGDLKKGSEVIFATFDDNTGIILHRTDGDWEYKTIKALEVHGDLKVTKNENDEDGTEGNVTVTDGNTTVEKGQAEVKKDVISHADVKTDVITLNTHVHQYTTPLHPSGPGDTTSGK